MSLRYCGGDRQKHPVVSMPKAMAFLNIYKINH